MPRSLTALLTLLIASQLAIALGAPADFLRDDLIPPATVPELFTDPPTVGGLFASAAQTDSAIGDAPLPAVSSDPISPSSHTATADMTKLGAPPAGIFLLIQGIVCIAFFRGRRKWAAVLVAAVALGRSGLNVLPRLLAMPKPHPTRVAEAPDPREDSTDLRASPPERGEVQYLGLLRRLGAEAGPDASRGHAPRFVLSKPAASGVSLGAGFSFSVPAEPPAQACLSGELYVAYAEAPEAPALVLQQFSPCLFARPPPTA